MRRILAPLLALVVLTGCPPPDEQTDEGFAPQVVTAEPSADEEAPLPAGESVTIQPENREAVLAVLKGIPAGERGKPLKFDLVRSIDRPIYQDVDESDGPPQWITIAEVQDDDGNVLWFDRVNTLYQLLEYLELVLNQQSSLNLTVNQVFQFVEMQYPQLLEFAVKVPTGIEGGTQYVLKVPDPDGELYEAFRVDISDLKENAAEPRLDGEIETIEENGPPEDTIDVVILGDGYTADQREKFTLDAQAIADRFVKAEPLKTNRKAFNIHTVWTPSAEAGAGYDCTGIITLDNGCKDDLRDTPFETVFVITALADRLGIELTNDSQGRVAMPLSIGKLFEAATAVPFDEIIMISNTKRTSGFAGLYVSILTAYDPRLGFPDTAVHEFGHSFGVLGDEYNIEGDPCLYNEPRIKLPNNISDTATLSDLKWSQWVEEGTPLPTPPAQADNIAVGAYASAYNCDDMYRPSHQCKMKNSSDDFCPVCAEQMVSRIYSVLDPTPLGEATATHTEADTLKFEVPTRKLSAVTWFMGEEQIGEGATLELEPADVPEDWTAVRAEVEESSGFVRAERPRLRDTHRWWIRR